jgi:hypothetical protein
VAISVLRFWIAHVEMEPELVIYDYNMNIHSINY